MITYFRPTNYHSLLAINKEELLAIERDLDNKYKNAADRNRGKKRKERQRDVVDSVNHKEGDEIEEEQSADNVEPVMHRSRQNRDRVCNSWLKLLPLTPYYL